MLVELELDRFASVQSLFSSQFVPAQAVIAGRAPGRILVNRAQQPTSAFMWNEFRYSYLGGDHTDAAFVTDLTHLLADELIPAARISHDPTVVFYPTADNWLAHLDQLIPNTRRVELSRQKFVFDGAQFTPNDWGQAIPDGLRIEQITGELAENIVTPLVGITWTSVAEFLAHGVGFCVLAGDTVVSSCFAVFAANRHLEISIDTHPDYRQRGLATVCGTAFVEYCQGHDLVPVWECWHDNTASIKLATKLGFQPTEKHKIRFVNLLEEQANIN